MEILAKRLKWLREKKRLAQKEVAAEIDLTLNAYQKYESGERDPKLEVLIKLSKLFNVSTDFMLGLSDFTPEYVTISFKIDRLREQIEENNTELGYMTSRIYEAQEELSNIKSEPYQITEQRERIDALESMIKEMSRRKQNREYDNHKNVSEYLATVSDYLVHLMNLPSANPKNDRIIAHLLPLEFTVADGQENRYMIGIKGKNGFRLSLDNYRSIEEAEKEKQRMENLFNG